MKNILIFIFLGCTTALIAQVKSDTTNVNPVSAPHEEKSHPTENLVKVKSKDITPGLKATLMREEYKGWEKGTLYFDTMTKEYALLMPDRQTEALKQNREIMAKKAPEHTGWYYFTYEGQPIYN
jgi:hypothetical protein